MSSAVHSSTIFPSERRRCCSLNSIAAIGSSLHRPFCDTPASSLACGRCLFSHLLHNLRERLEVALIDVAPAPLFAALIRHDDRVRRRSEVFGRVLVLGVITAPGVFLVRSQRHPAGWPLSLWR